MLLATLTLGVCAGCFGERATPMRPSDLRRVALVGAAERTAPHATRAWLREVAPQLQPLLPLGAGRPLLTEDLVHADGRPINVYQHFRLVPRLLHQVLFNYFGLLHTAQAAGTQVLNGAAPPAWPGFEDVWIPVAPGLALAGRLGLARDPHGAARSADCIVLIPGIAGDNTVRRTRDIAEALRTHGRHVLALELRSAGATYRRYPDVYYNFGVLETGDLLAVSDWLEAQPHVRRAGLIGYCWGGNLALLAAWESGRAADDPLVAPRLRPFLRARAGHRHFSAGVLAFSPVLRFEDVMDLLEVKDWPMWENPVLATLQDEIASRMQRGNYGEVRGSLRRLIELEYSRSSLTYPGVIPEGLTYLRLMPYEDQPIGPKLNAARVPVLIVHGANDPLCAAQDVADFVATVDNPAVAAMILPGGGHVGFAPYAREYFYSLMLNFYDPECGPATQTADDAPRRGALPPSP